MNSIEAARAGRAYGHGTSRAEWRGGHEASELGLGRTASRAERVEWCV